MLNTRTEIDDHGLDLVGRFGVSANTILLILLSGESPYRCFSSLGRLVLASSLNLRWARRTYQLHQL